LVEQRLTVAREERLRSSAEGAFVMAPNGWVLNMGQDDVKIARVGSSGPHLGGPLEAGRLDNLTPVRHLAIRMIISFEGKDFSINI
jgi:hypothetical protein